MEILIVDDNQGMVRTTSLILKHHGYNVTMAVSGEDAVELAKHKRFDFILMDIKMPIMNGVEAFRQIKQIQPDATVVMMTAYAVEDLIREALDEGAYGILYKPLDIDYMLSLIETAYTTHDNALILVVDDDPQFCKLIRDILERKEFDIMVANSGEEAINLAGSTSYDAILIDVKLPTINGLETYMAIREIDPEIVAIMMTAYRFEVEELIEQAITQNIYACLYKPFAMEDLLELLKEVTKRSRI